VWPEPVGTIHYRPGPTMSASNSLSIVVKGRQTHGAVPWGGVDPIAVSSQIVLALQTIVSRQIDLTLAPAVITIGMIQGGNRGNIIPDSVLMLGTIRTFDENMRKDIFDRVRRTAENIAKSAGATATVNIWGYGLVTYNDPALTERMLPALRRAAGDANVAVSKLVSASEDFPAFTQTIPGLYFFLGIVPRGQDLNTVPRNHSPFFAVDEAALPVGVRAMANLAVDFLKAGGKSSTGM
jgi:amidohydrolase